MSWSYDVARDCLFMDFYDAWTQQYDKSMNEAEKETTE